MYLVSEGAVLFLTFLYSKIHIYSILTLIKFIQNPYSNKIQNKRLLHKVVTTLTNPTTQNLRLLPRLYAHVHLRKLTRRH